MTRVRIGGGWGEGDLFQHEKGNKTHQTTKNPIKKKKKKTTKQKKKKKKKKHNPTPTTPLAAPIEGKKKKRAGGGTSHFPFGGGTKGRRFLGVNWRTHRRNGLWT